MDYSNQLETLARFNRSLRSVKTQVSAPATPVFIHLVSYESGLLASACLSILEYLEGVEISKGAMHPSNGSVEKLERLFRQTSTPESVPVHRHVPDQEIADTLVQYCADLYAWKQAIDFVRKHGKKIAHIILYARETDSGVVFKAVPIGTDGMISGRMLFEGRRHAR